MLLKLILISILASGIDAQTACSNYWQYVRGAGQIEGLLTLPLNNAYSEHSLKVTLSVATQLPSSYVGDINLVKEKNAALNDISYGNPVQYKVRFPVHNPLPRLAEVIYNNRRLCTGQKDTGNYITTINLDHYLYTVNGPSQSNYQPEVNYRPQVQYTQPPPTIRQTSAAPRLPAFANRQAIDFSYQCGVPSKTLADTGLVIGGRRASKGQFPWLVAFYHNTYGENDFICGGSLVSSRSIITAAHCVQDKDSKTLRPAYESFFYIGRHNLDASIRDRDYILSGVEKFIIHPDWGRQRETYDADIAIARLPRTITFTDYIKPICLWQSSHDHSDLVNQYGVIAGYGRTIENSQGSDTPMWVALPVVDDATCWRSHPQFSKISSQRTFCVGDRHGRGPCNGDSGGGFVVRYNGKWYLRGVVSASLLNPQTYSCDVNNYAVFTDVAAFTSWIQNNI